VACTYIIFVCGVAVLFGGVVLGLVLFLGFCFCVVRVKAFDICVWFFFPGWLSFVCFGIAVLLNVFFSTPKQKLTLISSTQQ